MKHVFCCLIATIVASIPTPIFAQTSAEFLRQITDPNARIVEELRLGFVGSTPEEAQKKIESQKSWIEARANEAPNEATYFAIFHNQTQDLAAVKHTLAGTLSYVDHIVFKQYSPADNTVWTTSVSDFENYQGNTTEKLEFIYRREAFRRHVIALTNSEASGHGLPPEVFDGHVYEIRGYATYGRIQSFAEENAASILHIEEMRNDRNSLEEMRATIDEAKRDGKLLPIPDLSGFDSTWSVSNQLQVGIGMPH